MFVLIEKANASRKSLFLLFLFWRNKQTNKHPSCGDLNYQLLVLFVCFLKKHAQSVFIALLSEEKALQIF